MQVGKEATQQPRGAVAKKRAPQATTMSQVVSKVSRVDVCPASSNKGAHIMYGHVDLKNTVNDVLAHRKIYTTRFSTVFDSRCCVVLYRPGYVSGGAFQPPQRSARAASSTEGTPPTTTPRQQRTVLNNITNQKHPRKCTRKHAFPQKLHGEKLSATHFCSIDHVRAFVPHQMHPRMD